MTFKWHDTVLKKNGENYTKKKLRSYKEEV
jgi:hypothetical protein